MKFGTNIAVFIIFFGVALIEAFQGRNWILVAVFLGLGFLSLFADLRDESK